MTTHEIIKLTLQNDPQYRLDLSNFPRMLEGNIADIDLIKDTVVIDGQKEEKLSTFFEVKKTTFLECFSKKGSLLKDEKAYTDDLPLLVFEGDLSKVDFIGYKMESLQLAIFGNTGNYLGLCNRGALINVYGCAGHYTGAMMDSGIIKITGDVGNYAGANLPGEMEGMRGGLLNVEGRAGNYFCRRMRRGIASTHKNAGNFFAANIIAGTVFLGGKAGDFFGYGMRRGTLIFLSCHEIPLGCYKRKDYDLSSFWGLLTPVFNRLGGKFRNISACNLERYVGDIAFEGKGEIIVCKKSFD